MSRVIGPRVPWAVVVALPVVCVVLVSGPQPPRSEAAKTPRPDVTIALWANGRCGNFADSLPPVVARTGLDAGGIAGDVTICVTSGDQPSGTLSLRTVSRTETDSGCTGDERAYDSTCGAGAAGELGPALVQQIGVGKCGKSPPGVDTRLDRSLPALDAGIGLGSLSSPSNTCVRLVLRYRPTTATAHAVSQSDTVTWRYAFDLVVP